MTALIPAADLWQLARAPLSLDLDPVVAASIAKIGWDESCPATLFLEAGRAPRVHGHHRLCHLAKIGRLSTLVPTRIEVAVTYPKTPRKRNLAADGGLNS